MTATTATGVLMQYQMNLRSSTVFLLEIKKPAPCQSNPARGFRFYLDDGWLAGVRDRVDPESRCDRYS
jgi:hypothetical protein